MGYSGYNNTRCQRDSDGNKAILENDIVKTDKQEQLAKTAGIRKDSGESE